MAFAPSPGCTRASDPCLQAASQDTGEVVVHQRDSYTAPEACAVTHQTHARHRAARQVRPDAVRPTEPEPHDLAFRPHVTWHLHRAAHRRADHGRTHTVAESSYALCLPDRGECMPCRTVLCAASASGTNRVCDVQPTMLSADRQSWRVGLNLGLN